MSSFGTIQEQARCRCAIDKVEEIYVAATALLVLARKLPAFDPLAANQSPTPA